MEKTPPAEAPAARRDPILAPDAARAITKLALTRDLTAWVSDWPKSWTDPRVIAALAEDCSFVPEKPRKPDPPEIGGGSTGDIFKCRLAYEQSCTIDPCKLPEGRCESTCTGTCDNCGGACATSCTSCKSACTDDACKMACATKCGECRQTCNRTMDRCVTGECAKVHDACNKRLTAMWNRSGCKARCAGYSRCRSKCANDGSDASDICTGRCDDTVSPGFRACNAKCDDLRLSEDQKDPDAPEACLMKCYETVPCAPSLCQGWSP